jgi:hypothetical protein
MPVLVVDDGSSDATSAEASRHGAAVLRLPKNRGKGNAMRIGAVASTLLVDSARPEDVVFFCDADLKGLMPEHVRKIVDPVLDGRCGMVVGLRDYGTAKNSISTKMPLISGERAIRRDILARMPREGWSGYAVETFLNHAAFRSGHRVAAVPLDGVSIHSKWDKEGPKEGFHKMVRMGVEVAGAYSDARRAEEGLLDVPPPASITAKTAEEVTRELTRHLVEAGGPYVRDELWTPAAQKRVGDALGKRLAPPLWALTCAACTAMFGPVAGITMAAGGILVSSLGEERLPASGFRQNRIRRGT